MLFDNGGGSLGPGALQPTYEAGFSAWPPAGTTVRFHLGPGGSLGTGAPPGSSTASFRPDPAARPADDLPPPGNAWAAQPPYDWTTVPAANGVAFETPAFTTATTIVGPASLNLLLRSTAPATDLQVTVTEVRPGDSQEEYVTSGFLRSSDRTLSRASTPLDPVPTYLASDRRDLPPGRFTLVRIPVDPIAHTFRAGTRLRIVISAPGGDRPSWTFQTPATHGAVLDTVALGGAGGSSLVVNEVAGVVPKAGTARLRRPARRAVPALRPPGQPDLTQSKLGRRSRVRLSSKKPSVPVQSRTPSQRRPAASPLGAGVTTGPKMALPVEVDDRRADVVADGVHAGAVRGGQRVVELVGRGRRGQRCREADLGQGLGDDRLAPRPPRGPRRSRWHPGPERRVERQQDVGALHPARPRCRPAPGPWPGPCAPCTRRRAPGGPG